MHKLIYDYRYLSPQPIQVYFCPEGYFKANGDFALLKADEMEVERTIRVKIRLSDVWYGPYETDVKATTRDFENRRLLYPTSIQKALTKALREWDGWIIDAWDKLLKTEPKMTGEMIWEQVSNPANRKPQRFAFLIK